MWNVRHTTPKLKSITAGAIPGGSGASCIQSQRPNHVIDTIPDIQVLARQVLRLVRSQVCCSFCTSFFFVQACNGIRRKLAPACLDHLSQPHIKPNLQVVLHDISELLPDMLWGDAGALHSCTPPVMLVSAKASEAVGCRLAICCLSMLAAM